MRRPILPGEEGGTHTEALAERLAHLYATRAVFDADGRAEVARLEAELDRRTAALADRLQACRARLAALESDLPVVSLSGLPAPP